MANYTRVTTFTTGQVLTASQLNTEFNAVQTAVNDVDENNLGTIGGNVTWTVSSNVDLLTLTKSGAGIGSLIDGSNAGTDPAIKISSTSTGDVIELTKSGVAAGKLLVGTNAGTDPSVDITNSSTGDILSLTHSGVGAGSLIDGSNAGTDPAIKIDSTSTGALVDLLVSAVQTFTITSAGEPVILATKKLYLDGALGVGGNTYLTESSADVISHFVGGIDRLQIEPQASGNACIKSVNQANLGYNHESLNTSAVFVDTMQRYIATRGATALYYFIEAKSGGASGDPEFRVEGDGAAYADGGFNGVAADYAEFFESLDGTALEVGRTLVLDNGKVRYALAGEQPMGVVRPNDASLVVGNGGWNRWAGKYLRDEYGSYQTESVDVYEWEEVLEVDKNKKSHSYEFDKVPEGVTVPADKTVVSSTRRVLNPAYDPTLEYIKRSDRQEWILTGLLGQVPIKKGEPVASSWKLMDSSGTLADIYFIK